jgi:hypothetical protein
MTRISLTAAGVVINDHPLHFSQSALTDLASFVGAAARRVWDGKYHAWHHERARGHGHRPDRQPGRRGRAPRSETPEDVVDEVNKALKKHKGGKKIYRLHSDGGFAFLVAAPSTITALRAAKVVAKLPAP